MAHVWINADKLGAAHKYANLIPDTNKRRYAQAYIAWLQNGAEGVEPEPKCSHIAAKSIRETIIGMRLWEGTK